MNSKADEEAHAANVVVRHNTAIEAKMQLFQKRTDAEFAVRQEHAYETHPAKLCEGCSDTMAVDLMKAQVKLVHAYGWVGQLMEHAAPSPKRRSSRRIATANPD